MSAAEARRRLRARRYQREPRRGEQRRGALLSALEQLLQTHSLTGIGIGDITEAAGLSRSAFYFYFPTKAAAVAALLEDVYQALLEASGRWHSVETGHATAELRAGFDAVAGYGYANPRLMVAIFDAIGADAEVRDMWRQSMDELAARVADKIARERRAGHAPEGVDPAVLATALVAMNERTLELEVRAVANGGTPREAMTDALCEIWRRAIYRSDP